MASTRATAAGDAAGDPALYLLQPRWRDAGITHVEWFAVVRNDTCDFCRARHGKVWDMHGRGVGHDLAIIPFPPSHKGCRCILLPHKYPPDA